MFCSMIANILFSMCLTAKMAAVQALPHSGNPHREPFNFVATVTRDGGVSSILQAPDHTKKH